MRTKRGLINRNWQLLNRSRSIDMQPFGLLTRYAGAGTIGTAVHFLILVLLVDTLGAVAASAIGAFAGLVVNFHLSRLLVFAVRKVGHGAFPRFATVAIGGFAINGTMMVSLTATLPAIPAQLITTGTVFCFGFFLNNVWTFNEQRTQY